MQVKYFVYKPYKVEVQNPKNFSTIAKVLLLKRLAIQLRFPIRGTPRHIYAKRAKFYISGHVVSITFNYQITSCVRGFHK